MMNQPLKTDANSTEVLPVAFRVACDRCSTGILKSTRISTAFWQGEGLVVIRNIPAMICPDCGEEYVDDQTIIRLDVMRGSGFAALPAIGQLIVPIRDYGAAE